MRQIGLAILFLFFCVFQSKAQEIYSVRSLSMASTTLANAFHSNPSALTTFDNNNISLSAENRFLESELTYYNLSADMHGKEIDLAVHVSHFGYSEYRDISTKLTLAKSFTPRVAAGIGIKMKTHKHVNADRNIYLGFTPGLLFSLPYYQKIGVSVSSDFLTSGDGDNIVLGNICYGITFDKHFFTIECDYTHNEEFIGKAGYEATVIQPLRIRCGLTFPEPSPSFGIGTSLGIIDLDLSYSFHTHLRGIFGLSLTANINKK